LKTIQSIKRYGDELQEIFTQKRAAVFLCGPAIDKLDKPGEQLRQDLEKALKTEGFDVILGEDDGLEQIRNKYSSYAHENELLFVEKHCLATVLIASSVGSFCELGLFSYKKVHTLKSDFILIISEQFKGKQSYLNEGPAAAIEDFGKVYYGDLQDFDYSDILQRLKRRRSVWITSYKGRRPKAMAK
jgi:hypothetical protein